MICLGPNCEKNAGRDRFCSKECRSAYSETTLSVPTAPRETTIVPKPVVSQPEPVVSRQRAWKQRQGGAWREHHAAYMRAYRGRRG